MPQQLTERQGVAKNNSPNHLEFLHSQDLMKAVKRATGTKNPLKTIEQIHNPVLKAIAIAFLKGSNDGQVYRVEGSPRVKDFEFSFIGKRGQPLARAPQNLVTKGVYHIRCRVCRKWVPALLIKIKLTIKQKSYRGSGEEVEEVEETRYGWLTIEGGKIHLSGEIGYEDLLKEGT